MSKKYQYTLQQNKEDCGVAAIMTILMNYGINPSREKILKTIPKKNNGYSAYDLIKISKQYGVEGSGIKTNFQNLKNLPVIAHTIKNKNMFHYIVIFEIDNRNKTLTIMDPSEGLKKITFEEFSEITTNIFLIFSGQKKKKIKNVRFKKEIKKVYDNNRNSIIKTLLLSIIYIVLSLSFNYYLKLVLSYSNNLNLLLVIFLLFLNINILKNIINYLKNKLILKISLKIDQDITKKISTHVLNLPYEYFISKTTGELVTIIEDTENYKEIITKIFVLSVVDIILISITIIYLCILKLAIGIALFAFIIISIIITKNYQYTFNDLYLKYKLSKIKYTSKLINYFTSFETIKNLNIKDKIGMNLTKEYDNLLKNDFNYNTKNNTYNLFSNLFIDAFYVILIFLSSYIAINNGIELLDIVLFSSVFYLIAGLLNNVNESICLYKVYESSIDRVLDCLDVEEESFSKTNFSQINKINFENIKYQKDSLDILSNIHLELKKGEKILITGESGIGKSSMIKLLLKYYQPTEGKILIDNININDIDLSFIRENITYIGQNEELFHGTVLENLNIVEKSEAKINKVARITLLDKFLKENKVDYNYPVEESGANLSGGERKKLILTRGLLHFKNVLVLDEVFNEISIEEEKEILKNIFESYKDKIIIMISHRLNNKQLFDKQYKLEGDGKLYEIK